MPATCPWTTWRPLGAAAAAASALRVLLVEDNPINREVALQFCCTARRCRWPTATTAKTPCAHGQRAPVIDLVLMDVQMPVMDGLQWPPAPSAAFAGQCVHAHRGHGQQRFEEDRFA